MRFLLGVARAIASSRPQATVIDARCSRYFTSGCTLCVDACPRDAILLTDVSVSVSDGCHGCGICATVCPAGAFSGVGMPTHALSVVLDEEARIQCDLAQEIDRSCEDVSVPCLGALDPELLAARAMSTEVTLTSGPCERCPIGHPETVHRGVERARSIVHASGGTGQIRREEAQFTDGKAERRRPAGALSRRGVFATETYVKPMDKSPRQHLLEAAALPALPQVTASEGCTGCNACGEVCPAGALRMQNGDLVFRPAACVGCAECVRVCPEDVLGLELVGTGRFPRRIASPVAETCSRCKFNLSPGESELCHRCRSRLDLSASIWEELGLTSDPSGSEE